MQLEFGISLIKLMYSLVQLVLCARTVKFLLIALDWIQDDAAVKSMSRYTIVSASSDD
jgi:hypothetical protein